MGSDVLARLQRLRRQRGVCASHQGPSDSLTPLPVDLLDAYRQHVVWEHQDTSAPVSGVTPIQQLCWDRATCWRSTPDGQRIAGRDLYLKSRKLYLTSFFMGLGSMAMARWPGLRFGVIAQKKADDIGMDLWGRCHRMIERFPVGWPTIVGARAGESITLNNGSSLVIMTAGSGPLIAEKVARAGTFHVLLLTEPGSYAYPEITWGAAKGAVPEASGWLIVEGTMPTDPDHWFYQEYLATRAGRGSLWSATFLPWYQDPQRIISQTSAQYPPLMGSDSWVPPEDLEQERALSLTDGQRAWRRMNYCRGDHRTRRENRREYPETDVVPKIVLTGDDITPYLDPDALRSLRQMVRTPAHTERLAADMVAQIWDPAPQYVLVTTDSAMPRSSTGDASVVLAINPWTRDLVAHVSGCHVGAKLHYQAILWLLSQLGCRELGKHLLAPEANRARLYGLIDDYLLTDRTLHLYWEERQVIRTGKVETAKYPGYWLTNRNRPQVVQALVRWVEGEEIERKAPQCLISSSALIEQLCTLIQWPDGTIRAAQGHHDDLAIAYGGALLISERIQIPRPGRAAPARHQDSDPPRRGLPVRIRDRGRVVPS